MPHKVVHTGMFGGIEGGQRLEDLTLPDGRIARDCNRDEVARILIAAGVPGIEHANGRNANLEHYAAHLKAMEKQAGKDAFARWVKDTTTGPR